MQNSVTVDFTLLCPLEKMDGDSMNVVGVRRRMLNAEKIIFGTDERGAIISASHVDCKVPIVVELSVKQWADRRYETRGSVLVYDLKLEKNSLGVPISAFYLAAMVMSSIFVCLFFIKLWTERTVPNIRFVSFQKTSP